jgi:membrane protein
VVVRDGWVERGRTLTLRLLDVVPGVRRTLHELARVEVIDRALVIAAQSLFSVTPLLVVLAAFSPDRFATSLSYHLADVMGVDHSTTSDLTSVATSDQVRTQTGIGGIVIVIFSAMSFARALQRMFERVWELPHRGGLVGNRRCLLWLVAFVAYLQLIALATSVLRADDLTVLRIVAQVVLSVASWWWTARVLLMNRVGWQPLLLGAVVTAVGLALLSHFSQVFMPPYVQSSVAQFGGLGLVFAASTWLLAFGGVLVVAALLGRVYTEEIGVLRRLTGVQVRGVD